jgi:uracil-DNA glycosylase
MLLLRDALREVVAGWRDDLDPAWRDFLADVEPDPDAIDPDLTLAPWEPIFPARKGQRFPGAPAGAHMLRAFDGIAPDAVRCVVLGQDPYPCPAFATGRAFEAGNVAQWRELDKMFSVSVRCFMQQIVAARTGDASRARRFADWPALLADIERGRVALEPPAGLAARWVGAGALLLNSAFTLSRFAVAGDPHQTRGHLPLWRPVVVAVLQRLAASGRPIAFIGFGAQAAHALQAAGVAADGAGDARCILRDHPAAGDAVLALPNPFVLANAWLTAQGAAPIDW